MNDLDYAYEQAILDLRDEALMDRAAHEQCIFLFVEGESEEVAIPELMTDVVDLNALGIKIANYNGHGNLSHALRLLNQALDHDRPIIVTHDNDPKSIESINRCRARGLLTDMTYTLPIPTTPVVQYSSGHLGGSFEEAFPAELFLDVAFTNAILPPVVVAERSRFERIFDSGRPWLSQLVQFSAKLGFTDWSPNKPALAETMAIECDDLPPAFGSLVGLVKRVREEHPLVHPDDVELPKIPGLT